MSCPHPVVVFICQGTGEVFWYRVACRPFWCRLCLMRAVLCVHCASFAFLFLVDIVGISKVGFVLFPVLFFCFIVSIYYQPWHASDFKVKSSEFR